MTNPVRYRSGDEDSGRWDGFPFRDGDIVISTRSKSGTTWVQMICALLVLRKPVLPMPLAELSPWIDHTVRPLPEVLADLDAQTHRRFVKTHTPLDGIPLDPAASYIVVARHPLDMAVSLYHQGNNIDRARLQELTGSPTPSAFEPPPLHDWLAGWAEGVHDPRENMDSLSGVLWHLNDAWKRQKDANVRLIHYADLQANLPGEMRSLAQWLNLDPPTEDLVEAATFAAMKQNADELVPDRQGIFKDRQAFFREGRSGSGEAALTSSEQARYRARVENETEPGLANWLNR